MFSMWNINTASAAAIGSRLTISGNPSPEVPEGVQFVAGYAVAGQVSTISWSLSGPDAGSFSIDSSGNLSFIIATNYEGLNGDTFSVNVVADDGTSVSAVAVTVKLLDVYENIAPLVLNQSATILDNANIGDTVLNIAAQDVEPLTYEILSGNTGNAFTITGGAITVASNIDYNDTPFITLQVRASDGSLTTDFSVVVSLIEYVDLVHPLISIDALFPEVHAEVPLSSYALRMFHARQTIIEFCKETYYWKQEIEPLQLNDLSSRYQLVAPSGLRLLDIENITATDIHGKQVELEKGPNDDRGASYLMLSPTIIEIVNQENLQSPIVITAVVQPDNNATLYSQEIHERYYETIIAGVKSRLLGMSGEPWQDMNKSQYYRSIFIDGYSSARRDNERGYAYQYRPRGEARRSFI